MKDTLERVASLLSTFDIDESICRKNKCDDEHDCVECIINFFKKPCQDERDGVCVNDSSEWCCDFIDNEKCGRCRYYYSDENN